MKLARNLVIEKLEARLVEIDKEKEDRLAKAARSHATAVRAFNRIKITEDSTRKQLDRASSLLHEIRNTTPEALNYRRSDSNYYKNQIKREIALLKLSSDVTVSIRTNSSLADFLAV